MSEMKADLVLLPWLRRGAAAGALTQVDSLGPDQPGVATALASLTVNNATPIAKDVRLMGPGHVTGLLPGQVIRMDPTPGSRAFESNYFPVVEFDEPSLPWLFTPAKATDSQRLRPWLCLVVVRKQPGVQLSPPRRGSLPVLTISSPAVPKAELPDLADSWAWAHAQITGELPALGLGGAETDQAVTELLRLLRDRPDRTLSRLVSSRILAPSTEYWACVVPTFELGRLAGLGLDIKAEEEAKLRPAWTLANNPPSVELPIYHSWEFASGSEGDFQSLAMLLRARQVPAGVGVRHIDISKSGVGTPLPQGVSLPLGGALRPVPASLALPTGSAEPNALPSPWPTPATRQAFRAKLAQILNAPDATPSNRPLLAPPRYGATQSGSSSLDPARENRWYEQLNLDPSARVAAQYGTRFVQEQQEALVASAWEQAADLRAVNRELGNAQLVLQLAVSLHQRHLSRMSPSAGLQALGPAQVALTSSALAQRPNGLVALMSAAQIPSAGFSTALRRITRPQGAITRRVSRAASTVGTSPPTLLSVSTATIAKITTTATTATTATRPLTVLESLQPVAREQSIALARVIPQSSVDGVLTLERATAQLQPPRNDIAWQEATAAAVKGAPQRPSFAFTPLTPPTKPPTTTPPTTTVFTGVVTHLTAAATTAFSKAISATPTVGRNPTAVAPVVLTPVRPADSAAAAAFRKVAEAHLQRFIVVRPAPQKVLTIAATIDAVFKEALMRAQPLETLNARVVLRIDRRGGAPAPAAPSAADLDAAVFTPHFPQPLAPQLGAMDQDLILPGLDLVPPNTVVPLETNSPFVEAVLVGFNTELGRELVWREFPTPLLATYADRFWNSGSTERPPDIPPLAEWGERQLGARFGTNAGAGERFVVLLRSELLRRYPDAVVYAIRTNEPTKPPALPILCGSMDPDVRFFGFDIAAADIQSWSIVVAEQPTAPRFGIEVSDRPALAAGSTHLPITNQDGDAARLGHRLRQHPVRVTIPASVLLKPRG